MCYQNYKKIIGLNNVVRLNRFTKATIVIQRKIVLTSSREKNAGG